MLADKDFRLLLYTRFPLPVNFWPEFFHAAPWSFVLDIHLSFFKIAIRQGLWSIAQRNKLWKVQHRATSVCVELETLLHKEVFKYEVVVHN